MDSHELARQLLRLPNLPVGTHAMNQSYFSMGDRHSHGRIRIARCHHYSGDHILIGDISKRFLNPPNWFVHEPLDGHPMSDTWNLKDRPYLGPTNPPVQHKSMCHWRN